MTNYAIKLGVAAAVVAAVPLTLLTDALRSELTYDQLQQSAKASAIEAFRKAGCTGKGVLGAEVIDTVGGILIKDDFVDLRGIITKRKDGGYDIRVLDMTNVGETTAPERLNVKSICPTSQNVTVKQTKVAAAG